MSTSIPVKQKKRGRPKTGRNPSDPIVGVRFSPDIIKALDRAAEAAGERRSETVRRLVELGLAGSQPPKPRHPKAAAKASDMAAEQIDKLADPAMPEEERRARKRRLIKGPEEFREMRGDQSKRKG